ncbi:hypothetical protein HMPREF1870_01727 [Bacteroidales bacterium KA00344]|nr:hypothetical protein HMPREF1870_01727 [Bacteroidales bacterium KA00344]
MSRKLHYKTVCIFVCSSTSIPVFCKQFFIGRMRKSMGSCGWASTVL